MLYILLYLIAIILANLSVAIFGRNFPQITIVNALLFIGLHLPPRAQFNEPGRGRGLLPKMLAPIAAGSALSWLLNRAAGPVALASFTAFAAAAGVDTLVYQLLGRYPRWLRVNGSNVPSAAVDSLIFPTLAFGALLWPIVLGQFLAKTLGGFLWSLLFRQLDRRGGQETTGA